MIFGTPACWVADHREYIMDQANTAFDGERLKNYISVLASDEFGGRFPSTEGMVPCSNTLGSMFFFFLLRTLLEHR